MERVRILSILAAAALALAGCAPTRPAEDARLGGAPVLAGGVYSIGGAILVAADVRERDGRTVLCGVWARDAQPVMVMHENGKVLSAGSVFLDGRRLVTGLGFLPETRPGQDYAGRPAACVETALDWRPGFAEAPLAIRLPRQIVSNDSDSPLEGGIVVKFRQTANAPQL